MTRYFIEQQPDKFYLKSELETVKARARRLSKQRDDLVYVLAERFDPDLRDYEVIGSIAFSRGYQDAVEGEIA